MANVKITNPSTKMKFNAHKENKSDADVIANRFTGGVFEYLSRGLQESFPNLTAMAMILFVKIAFYATDS